MKIPVVREIADENCMVQMIIVVRYEEYNGNFLIISIF